MRASAQRLRLGLFCLCVIALVLAAEHFSASTRAPGAVSVARAPTSSRATQNNDHFRSRLRIETHRFLSVFLRYETGKGGPEVRRELSATATPAFAEQLLSAPPRREGETLAAARLRRLSITTIPVLPPRALINASARRGTHIEHISFFFDLHHGRWLARGLGE